MLTPKSHSFTCPRVFTSIFDGFTSVGTKPDFIYVILDNAHTEIVMSIGMVDFNRIVGTIIISVIDFNRKYFKDTSQMQALVGNSH